MRRRLLPLALIPLLLSCEAVMKENTDPGAPGGVPTTGAQLTTPPNPCTGCALVPTTFTRTDGQTKPYVREFGGDPAADYLLIVQDDGQEGTRAEIKLNGETVIASSALYGLKVAEIKKSVVLQTSNRLTVLPLGKVGAKVTVWIERVYYRPTPVLVQESDFGSLPLFLLTTNGSPSPVRAGASSVLASTTAPQLIFVFSTDSQPRGYTLSTVANGAVTVLPASAASTVLSLIFATPGIVTTDPVEFPTVVSRIQALPCYNTLVSILTAELVQKNLPTVLADPTVGAGFRSCIRSYFAGYPSTLRASAVQGTDGVTISTSGQAGAEVAAIANAGWRCVQIDRRDVPFGGATLPLVRVTDNMSGAVALSWGALFARTVNQPSVTVDPSFSPNVAPSAEYWISGPGWKTSPPVPLDLQAPPHRAILCSVMQYLLWPTLDLTLGFVKPSQVAQWVSDAVDVAEGSVDLSEYYNADPSDPAAVDAASWNLAIDLIPFWIQAGVASGALSPAAAKTLLLVAKVNALFSGVGSAIGWIQTLANVSAYATVTVPRSVITGDIRGVISSPQLGPLQGVVVRATQPPTTVQSVSLAAGTYTLSSVPVGPVALTFANLPLGCAVPSPISATVLANVSVLVDVSVNCSGGGGLPTGIWTGTQSLNDPPTAAAVDYAIKLDFTNKTALSSACINPGTIQSVTATQIVVDYSGCGIETISNYTLGSTTLKGSGVETASSGGRTITSAWDLTSTPPTASGVWSGTHDVGVANYALQVDFGAATATSGFCQGVTGTLIVTQALLGVLYQGCALETVSYSSSSQLLTASGTLEQRPSSQKFTSSWRLTPGSGGGTGTLLYSDDFSAGLGNWVQHGSGGSWTTAGGELIGDYGVSCGSSTCSQTQLVLADALQPGSGDWRIEVQSGLVQAYCCTMMVNLGKFTLYISDTNKESFDAGQSWPSGTVPATATTAYGAHQAYPWTSIGFATVTVPSWSPAAWQTVAFEKRGNQYTLFFNGVQVYQATRTFSSPPKVGFTTYGKVRMDNFKLYRLP